jgi:hypothetical protein
MVKRKNVQRGDGFFGDMWNGIKKAANFVKDNKIISKVAGLTGNPVLSGVTGMVGLGKKKGKAKKSKSQGGKGKKKKQLVS